MTNYLVKKTTTNKSAELVNEERNWMNQQGGPKKGLGRKVNLPIVEKTQPALLMQMGSGGGASGKIG